MPCGEILCCWPNRVLRDGEAIPLGSLVCPFNPMILEDEVCGRKTLAEFLDSSKKRRCGCACSGCLSNTLRLRERCECCADGRYWLNVEPASDDVAWARIRIWIRIRRVNSGHSGA
jgi:hypothetical protein